MNAKNLKLSDLTDANGFGNFSSIPNAVRHLEHCNSAHSVYYNHDTEQVIVAVNRYMTALRNLGFELFIDWPEEMTDEQLSGINEDAEEENC